MTQHRHGSLIWQGAHVAWKYGTFKDDTTFEIHPHFELTVTNPKTGESVTWNNIEVSSDDSSIKGITDFTKLPKELMVGILDNCIQKLNEPDDKTRISDSGIHFQ